MKITVVYNINETNDDYSYVIKMLKNRLMPGELEYILHKLSEHTEDCVTLTLGDFVEKNEIANVRLNAIRDFVNTVR